MKFIHLSDLHLGKRVNEFSMIEDQEYILTKIINIIDEEQADGVFIAGDVYDKSVPTEEAIRLWDNFLNRLAKRKIDAWAISGNHDSAVRFSNHNRLVDLAGIHLSPVYDGNIKPYTVTGDCRVNIYLLPFIKPGTVRQYFPEEKTESYTDACRVAIEHMGIDENEINILLAHQFVTGAERCDSEEVIVGGLDNVDASVFEPFDYVALGHIHGKQSIGRPTVRYCGTPLKYSISEKNHVKSVTVVEIHSKENIEIREIPLIPKHDLREIKGTFAEFSDKTFYENGDRQDYIHAILTDEEDVVDGMAKLRNIYPNLMKLNYDNKRTREKREVSDVQNIESKSPLELFGEFYEQMNNQPMSEDQKKFLSDMIQSIWGV